MLLHVLLTFGLAHAAPPVGLPPLPPGHLMSSSEGPERLMLEVRTASSHTTVRIQTTKGSDDDESPRCVAGNLALEVVRQQGTPLPTLEGWLDATCAALSQLDLSTHTADPAPHGPILPQVEPEPWLLPGPALPQPPHGVRQASRWPLRPMHAIGALALLALMSLSPRRRGPWAWAALAAIVRLGLTQPRIFMGIGYPFLRMSEADGLRAAPSPYGDTWNAVMGAVWYISGASADHVLHTNTALSVMAVVLLWMVVQRTVGSRAAHAAAAMLALHPLAIGMARTEVMFHLVTLLQLAAVLGVVQRGRRGDLLAVTSTLLLVHLRPFQLFFSPVIVLALGAHRRWLAVAATVAVIAHRAWDVATSIQASGGMPSSAGANLLHLILDPRHQFGRGGAMAVADPWVSPFPLVLLVVAALVLRHPKRRAAWLFFAMWVIATVPYLHFHRLTDVLRFALPGLAWWCALAALGLFALPGRARGWALVLVAAGTWVARQPLGPPLLWAVEHDAMMARARALPPDARVWYTQGWDRNQHFRAWMALQGHGFWAPFTEGFPTDGDLAWRGRSDVWPDAPAWPCEAEPVDVVTLQGHWIDVEPRVDGPFDAGLYRLKGCPKP